MRPLFSNLHSGVMDVTLRTGSATPATGENSDVYLQSSSQWESSSTKRAKLESYTLRSNPENGV